MESIASRNNRHGLGAISAILAALSLGGCDSDGPAIEARPQTITFGAAPTLALNDSATVTAAASSGLAIRYSSTTPAICSVNSVTGVVTASSVGTCVVAANQSGNTTYAPAPQTTQSLPVVFDSSQSGATNAAGEGVPSAQTDVTTYDVVETFLEPDTQPRNSIFVGSFSFNSTTGAVSNLHGILSESMTGDQIAYPNDNMTWLSLNNQLSSVYAPALGGLLVTTFLLPTTNTLWTGTGGDGWEPGSGDGIYYGFSKANPGNAYARIFVNTTNPTAPLTQVQIDMLAYADCSPSGMMGATCMTGTTVAGYGAVGTMSGYPISQTITRR